MATHLGFLKKGTASYLLMRLKSGLQPLSSRWVILCLNDVSKALCARRPGFDACILLLGFITCLKIHMK